MRAIPMFLAVILTAGCATPPSGFKLVKYGDPKDGTQVVYRKPGAQQPDFVPTGAPRPRGSLNPKLH